MQRVLVFDSDVAFAQTVQRGFSEHGARVDVVDDGDVGLRLALANRPDLILVALELPTTSGFSVCQKLRNREELRAVPVVMLSSSPDADQKFEDHRRLRRARADDYLRKPIDFDELWMRVNALVDTKSNGGDVEHEDEHTHVAPRPKQVDAEIDAFTENAFDNLIADGLDASPAKPVERMDTEDEVEIVIDEGDLVSERPPAPVPEARESDPISAEVSVIRGRVEELEAELRRRDETIASLKAKTSAAASSAVARGGGVSSREFLDLREQLNSKDKEILALKDQITSRDKQLLELRDGNIQLERGVADFEDRILGLERQLGDAQEQVDALRTDKEAANKRAEDFRARVDRADAKGKKLEDELATERRARAEEVDGLKSQHQQTIDEQKVRFDTAIARARADHAAEKEALRTDQESRIEAATSEHLAEMEALTAQHAEELERTRVEHASIVDTQREQHAAEVAKLTRANQAAIAELEQSHRETLERERGEHAAEIAQRIAELEDARDTALRALREDLEESNRKALAGAERRREDEVGTLREEHANELADRERRLNEQAEATLAEQRTEHDRSLALVGRKLAEAEEQLHDTSESLARNETRVGELERERATRTAEREDVSAQLGATQRRVDQLEEVEQAQQMQITELSSRLSRAEDQVGSLRAKIELDEELLVRLRKAIAISASLLDEQQQNQI